jgi:hypothetical protein
MKVQEMEFTFTYKKKDIRVNCSKFKPAKTMMYRVLIPGTKEDDQVYVFYENEKKRKLVWYELPDERKQEKAKFIASTLESIIFLPN